MASSVKFERPTRSFPNTDFIDTIFFACIQNLWCQDWIVDYPSTQYQAN